MKKGKIALYDPYLDVMGGGEKHILAILKALEDDYELHIFWDSNLQDAFKKQFDLEFKNKIIFHAGIFGPGTSLLKRTFELAGYEAFFYVTDGSYFYSPAKRNFIFCMVPEKKRYVMNAVNKLKTKNATFIANSKFTGDYLSKLGIESKVLYPYIDQSFFDDKKTKKEDTILSVGRYFRHLHNKNFKAVIESFQALRERSVGHEKTSLVFAGGLLDEDQGYFDEVRKLAGGDRAIKMLTNVPFPKLLALYKSATYYWHFTGYGIDEEKEPEKTEHLGITPLEAMAAGAVVFCFRAGGPKELIEDGVNGFLFSTIDELIEKMERLTKDPALCQQIVKNARVYMNETFSYNVFEKNVQKVLGL